MLLMSCRLPTALMTKATVLSGGAMSTGTWLGATVATMQSLGTGLALSTKVLLAGVGGAAGGVMTRLGAAHSGEPVVAVAGVPADSATGGITAGSTASGKYGLSSVHHLHASES